MTPPSRVIKTTLTHKVLVGKETRSNKTPLLDPQEYASNLHTINTHPYQEMENPASFLTLHLTGYHQNPIHTKTKWIYSPHILMKIFPTTVSHYSFSDEDEGDARSTSTWFILMWHNRSCKLKNRLKEKNDNCYYYGAGGDAHVRTNGGTRGSSLD